MEHSIPVSSFIGRLQGVRHTSLFYSTSLRSGGDLHTEAANASRHHLFFFLSLRRLCALIPALYRPFAFKEKSSGH